MPVHFFYEDVEFRLSKPRITKTWIKNAINSENKELGELNYIFCSDSFLAQLNLKYLSHNTYTDIITFDYNDGSNTIQGDMFISTDRVKENSKKFGTEFDHELHRVIIHGALHLIGFSDKSHKAKDTMRKKEDAYLSLMLF
jgi:probable rRNA maturation factor